MDLSYAKQFLQERAKELGFDGVIHIRQPEHIGVVSFVVEYPDGSLVDLGQSVQAAETEIKRLTGQLDFKPAKRQPEPEQKPAKARAKK